MGAASRPNAGAGRVRGVRGAALVVLALGSVGIAAHTPILLPDLLLPVVVAGALVGVGVRRCAR